MRILFTEPVRFVGHFHVILLTWSAHLELLLQQKGSGFLVDAIQFVKRIIGDYIHFFFLTNVFRSTNSLLDLNKMMMTDKYCYCFRDFEDCRFTIIWLFLPLTLVGWAQKMFPYFRGKIFFFFSGAYSIYY